jgi:hypothetical protein
MHRESSREESEEDSEGGGWKCERETEGSESNGE